MLIVINKIRFNLLNVTEFDAAAGRITFVNGDTLMLGPAEITTLVTFWDSHAEKLYAPVQTPVEPADDGSGRDFSLGHEGP